MKTFENIAISPAIATDVKGMQEVFYRAWLATYPNQEFGITVDDIEDRFKDRLSEEALAKRVVRITNPTEDEINLVAREGGVVVGLCRLIRYHDKNQLQAIYILPEFQGRGIGKMLWEEIQKTLDWSKPTIVQVATYNTKAINFYQKLGFRDSGKRLSDEKFRMKSGATIPEMEMMLQS